MDLDNIQLKFVAFKDSLTIKNIPAFLALIVGLIGAFAGFTLLAQQIAVDMLWYQLFYFLSGGLLSILGTIYFHKVKYKSIRVFIFAGFILFIGLLISNTGPSTSLKDIGFSASLTSNFVMELTLILFGLVVAAFALSALNQFDPVGDEKGVKLFLIVTMLVVLYPLIIIIGTVVIEGAPGLTFDFLTQDVRRLGAEGGILPAITGTLLLMILMFIIAVPLGVCAGIYLQEYAGEHIIVRIIKTAVSVLRGVPSIVFGLFALAFFVPIFGVSFLSGGLVLSFYALPMIIRTSAESLRGIPMGLREGSFALGATKWQTIKKIVLPPALPGILTGIVLGIGEAAGETAPIIFLSQLNGDAIPGLFDTITALPMHLFSLFQYRGYGDPVLVAQRNINAWATAFILLLIILALNIVGLIIREKYRKEF